MECIFFLTHTLIFITFLKKEEKKQWKSGLNNRIRFNRFLECAFQLAEKMTLIREITFVHIEINIYELTVKVQSQQILKWNIRIYIVFSNLQFIVDIAKIDVTCIDGSQWCIKINR